MEIAYWIVAGVLAAFYLYAGGKKAVQSQEQLAPMMGWVDTVPMGLVRVIGTVEILGAAGLVLPPLTGIAPVLALVAALGLLVLQVLAGALHLSRGEAKETGLNAALIALAAGAVWLATTW
ncbi:MULTISPECIES: DoxX family protein [Streptomyces]|uniref:DoxX family protein n=1 Tax=Streptomyces poriferorum TaxID=2798799 RepID=A0ABY9IM32_9ACTN|nr:MULTISPECIES: DoxX family protein [unclassified Streptomyces]MDP5315238.1 DoxX family protein [Streptomyces sp. Alt4]WLQ55899.1 DoxX family protein [Streptomyces sp. Alt2]WSI66303.1 DoxX family protein [Streptomyces sp. NBC_01336]